MKIIKYSVKRANVANVQRVLSDTINQLADEVERVQQVTNNFTVSYDTAGNKVLTSDVVVNVHAAADGPIEAVPAL